MTYFIIHKCCRIVVLQSIGRGLLLSSRGKQSTKRRYTAILLRGCSTRSSGRSTCCSLPLTIVGSLYIRSGNVAFFHLTDQTLILFHCHRWRRRWSCQKTADDGRIFQRMCWSRPICLFCFRKTNRLMFTLRVKFSGLVYCNWSCLCMRLFVCLWVRLFVCRSVTTITRDCVHRSLPNWVFRWR